MWRLGAKPKTDEAAPKGGLTASHRGDVGDALKHGGGSA